MKFWLMKSEPDVFGIDDLRRKGKKGAHWDGVRNYQARNFLRDEMKKGDLAFFYHSNATPPGIVGIMEISSAAYPDFTAFDPEDPHYDPKSSEDNPRWYMVDVVHRKTFAKPLSLQDLKQIPGLEAMLILRRGNRLSITPVSEREWQIINEHAE